MDFIEIIKAIFYGIVEGITEWLPVSSTGHLILFERFWNFNSNPEFIEMFRVVIQLGAIVSVLVLFFKNIWPFGLKGNGIKGKDKPLILGLTLKWDIFMLWLKIAVACLPAVLYAFLLDDTVSEFLATNVGSTTIPYEFLVVVLMLIIVGILFIIIENKNKNRIPKTESVLDITFRDAFLIGIFQLVAAMLPGTSRSGATILGALLLGVTRAAAAEFTFYLAIPVMFGASLWKGYKFFETGLAVSSTEWAVLVVGLLVAFVVSIVAIRFLMNFVKKHDFKVFGWYRIVLGAVLLVYFIFNVV